VKTRAEWVRIYRVITGACRIGCQNFLSGIKVKKTYKLAEVISLTENQYQGHTFKNFFKGD